MVLHSMVRFSQIILKLIKEKQVCDSDIRKQAGCGEMVVPGTDTWRGADRSLFLFF